MTAGELFNISGQVALVTGASSGLGLRFAEVLAENGAAVALDLGVREAPASSAIASGALSSTAR